MCTEGTDPNRPASETSASSAEILAMARERIDAEAAALQAAGAGLTGAFADAARLIDSAEGRVITAAVGTSGPVAQRLAHLLSTTGRPASFLHPGDALHGGLGAVTARDAVLVISKGGRSEEVNAFARLVKERGASLVALTARTDSPLATLCDVAVPVATADGADPGGILAMGSSLAVAAVGDALVMVLMSMGDYTWDEVLRAHPSGAVGHLATPDGGSS